MKPIKLIVKTKSQKYPIVIGNNIVTKLKKIIDRNSIILINACW